MEQFSDEEMIIKLDALQKENERLKDGQAQINLMIRKLLELVQGQEVTLRALDRLSMINRIRLESLPYEMQDKSYVSPVFYPKVMTSKETIESVVASGRSIGRFGDGEFGIIAGVKRWNFQSESDYLSKRLVEVLNSKEEGFLVGINPTFYINLESMPEVNADAIRRYMSPDVRLLHAELLDPDRYYADALAFFVKSNEEYQSVKRLWDNKDITIIEGEYTRMGVGNDLYDNSRSIRRILCPAENAIERYDEILETTLNESRDRLILIALGPTATILSYDLFRAGFQAVDIGHIDLYYEKMLRNLDRLDHVVIPYKYCNGDEVADTKRDIPDVTDEAYLSEIVARIV